MNSPDTLDFEALLRPIEGENPAGEDLRSDPSPVSPYYQVKDARSAARAAERSGSLFENGHQLVSPEWRTVLNLAPEILATKAKDLEIAAWLTEALVRQHGFAGLRDGFRLTRELVEQFWDALYPLPDEDGISSRVAPLAGLAGGESEGTLAVPIALAPITGEGDHGTFGLWRFGKARDQAKAGAEVDPGASDTMEKFEAAVRVTDPDFFRCLAGDVDAALDHFLQLTALLDERCGHDSPPSSAIRSALQDAKQTVAHVIRDVAGIAIDDGEAEDEAPTAAAGPEAGAATATKPAAAGEIRTREDAFRVLSKVAEWFRDNEPHSPLSSLLLQSVRWGRMPLRQLIDELIPDSEARSHFGLLTGLGGKSAAAGDSEADE